LDLLVLLLIIHVEAPVCLEPVFAGFYGESSDKATTENAHHAGPPPDIFVEALQHICALGVQRLVYGFFGAGKTF
jgi:hypothetical protein